jgi:hypothetical protein
LYFQPDTIRRRIQWQIPNPESGLAASAGPGSCLMFDKMAVKPHAAPNAEKNAIDASVKPGTRKTRHISKKSI